jgi:hypothetical protein
MLSLYNNRLNGILADEMGLGKTVQVRLHFLEKHVMDLFRFMFVNWICVDGTETAQNAPPNTSTNWGPQIMRALSVAPVHYHI